MLHLILGRAGAGKTTYIRDLLCAEVRRKESAYRRIFLIVPEQNSFESERALLRKLGERDARRVEVLSFTRLTDTVMREYGGLAGKRLDDCGRSIFMSLALEQMSGNLQLYRKHVENPDFISMMVGAAAEFKMNGVTPDKLESTAGLLPEGALQKKAKEVSLVLSAYDALIAQSYVDPQDDLLRLEKKLEEHNFFQGTLVVLDAFKGFTAQERHVLALVMRQAQDMVVTLCAGKEGAQGETGLFSPVRRTARFFFNTARRYSIPVASPIHLKPGRRFENQELAALEESVFREGAAGTPLQCTHVTVYPAAHRYAEADRVARTVRRLVREEGYRYRDFAVIMREESLYSGVIDTALSKYEIPYFMDLPQEVESKPLMAFVLSALEAVVSNWDSDQLFRCLKTGMAGFSAEEIAELENYCFVWDISGGKWEKAWTANPSGFTEGVSPEEEQLLARLNRMREKIMDPLLRMKKMKGSGTGLDFATAVYRLLESMEVSSHLKTTAAELMRSGMPGLAEEQLRLWDILMSLLDQTALVLKKSTLDLKRYYKLLKMAVQSAEIAFIPQSLDEVLVGGADRIRPARPKVVFLMGANQGVFPASVTSSGLFSDQERRALMEAGLEMADAIEERAAEERFLAYTSIASPSQRLFITYSLSTPTGEGMFPSAIVAEIKRALPLLEEAPEEEITGPEGIEGEQQAFELLASRWREDSAFVSSLYGWFGKKEEYAPSMQAIEAMNAPQRLGFADSGRATALFGKDMRLSPSRVEKYHQCPFSYFCQYGLNAKVRKPAKIDALEYGTLIHYILENLLRCYSREEFVAITRPLLRAKVRELLEEYMEKKLGGWEDKTERFCYLYRRFETTAVTLAMHLAAELAQSSFEPADMELEIGADVEPVELELPNGGTISVRGKIDRVDVMHSRGKSFVRVVDYKTGAKQFRLSDILYGLNMQMLIYLVTLWKNGAARYGEVVPAGVLYMPAKNPRIEGVRGEPQAVAERRKEAELRMSGLVLDDPEVIEGMEKKAEGFFIPVRYKKDGSPDSSAQLASLAELGYLARHIERLLTQMGEQLQHGAVSPSPTEQACDYCDYADVCGKEDDMPVREIINQKNQEVYRTMRAVYGGEDGKHGE